MKKIVNDYQFVPIENELYSDSFSGLSIENVLLIVNLSSGVILYSPANPSHANASLSGTLFIFGSDISANLQTDKLQIWIDDGVSPARNDNLDSLVYLANMIAERMPMLDTLDRAVVSGAVTVSGSLTTLTTVTNVTSLNSMQSQPTAMAPYNWASGAYHIYSGIQVTP